MSTIPPRETLGRKIHNLLTRLRRFFILSQIYMGFRQMPDLYFNLLLSLLPNYLRCPTVEFSRVAEHSVATPPATLRWATTPVGIVL